MTPYITADRVADTIRKVLERDLDHEIDKADLITEFATGFFPDSPSAQRAFIRQCMPDSESNPLCFDHELCGFCRGSGYIVEPDTCDRVPCYCQGEGEESMRPNPLPSGYFKTERGLYKLEAKQCCYRRPSPNLPAPCTEPCTADAVWAIQGLGAPGYLLTYACDAHLPREIETMQRNKVSEVTVCPLKVQLPFEPDEEEVGYSYDPDEDIGPPYDDEGGFYEPGADADCYEELDRGQYDHTGPANDPDFDAGKEFEEMLKRFRNEIVNRPRSLPPGGMWARSGEQLYKMVREDTGQMEYIPVGEPSGEPDQDTPEGLYLRNGVLYLVKRMWGITDSFPVDEHGNALEGVIRAKPPGKIHSYPIEPDRCAVCGMPSPETYLALCEGCGELTCGRCMLYQVDYEDAYEHDIENHLRYEEFHGEPDEGGGEHTITVVDEKEGFCCKTHEALHHVLRALKLSRELIEARSRELTQAHYDEELSDLSKPHTPGMHKEVLTESPFPKGFFGIEEDN